MRSASEDGVGNWIRLPGRHYKRPHWTQIWNGERWLEEEEAVAEILNHRGDPAGLVAPWVELAAREQAEVDARRQKLKTEAEARTAMQRTAGFVPGGGVHDDSTTFESAVFALPNSGDVTHYD